MKKICLVLKIGLIVLFVPMFFACIMLLAQMSNVYKVIKYSNMGNGFHAKWFVVDSISYKSAGAGKSPFTYFDGEIDGQRVSAWKVDIATNTRQQNPRLGDTIYVWYNTSEPYFLLARNKEEIVYRPIHYYFDVFPRFVFTMIPTYLLLLIVYKRLKKKLKANETK
ncbi:hypothetical protein [Williamwhitmania taraxaci]|uniref:DUF3592 domain-containing protein n=1 Tax=Williamwhitmania taraxaci TaxID=1640674 RepID=A0A1G6IWX7_9BACT|nr:hypothetical protein [Williamwhitmania taraxaci]SDC10974.1 hypothetical protein SAMN05216323_101752 [Williamwhitmania taraxaci]